MPDEEIFIALLHSYEHVRTHTHAHEAKKGWYGGGSYSPMHGEGGCVVAFSKDRMSRCSGKPHLHKIFTFPEVVYRSMRWYVVHMGGRNTLYTSMGNTRFPS